MVFGFLKRKPQPAQRTYSFDSLPDGKYIVKYVDETYSYDEFILVVLKVTRGAHTGCTVPALFTSQKAKKISRDYSGDFLGRLAFEGDAKACKLEDAISYSKEDSKNEFIVNLKESYVSSMPEHDYETVERMIKRLSK